MLEQESEPQGYTFQPSGKVRVSNPGTDSTPTSTLSKPGRDLALTLSLHSGKQNATDADGSQRPDATGAYCSRSSGRRPSSARFTNATRRSGHHHSATRSAGRICQTLPPREPLRRPTTRSRTAWRARPVLTRAVTRRRTIRMSSTTDRSSVSDNTGPGTPLRIQVWSGGLWDLHRFNGGRVLPAVPPRSRFHVRLGGSLALGPCRSHSGRW